MLTDIMKRYDNGMLSIANQRRKNQRVLGISKIYNNKITDDLGTDLRLSSTAELFLDKSVNPSKESSSNFFQKEAGNK